MKQQSINIIIHATVTPEEYEIIEKLAKREKRSKSAMIRVLIAEAIEARQEILQPAS